jgi:Zn-dependent protease
LPLGALACDPCHALVHSEELVRISARAKALEEQDQLLQAREEWLKALPLLPPSSTQAEWIRGQAYKLELAAKVAPPPEEKHSWARKLGPLAPIAIVLAKSKTLLLAIFKLKFLFSLFVFMGVYWTLFGPAFGVGLAVLILVHEMGHYIDIRRRGLPADMPVFLPGLGAYVRWQALGVTRQTRAAVSLAGPLAGLLGAAVCAYLWHQTGNGLWAALARISAGLNILNLIPIWILDGGQAAVALSKTERLILLAACLFLWLFVGESVFVLVAAGVVYRLFTKDLPPQPSPAIAAYFVGVLLALGLLIHQIPGAGLVAR